jgi:hypothetical protein
MEATGFRRGTIHKTGAYVVLRHPAAVDLLQQLDPILFMLCS